MSRNFGANAAAWLDSGKPERIVGFLLKTLNHGLRQAINDALREHRVRLSFAQLSTLFSLFFEPGLTGAQLARRGTVSAQTMNSMLRNLEAAGFIERRPHPESRRADSWFLTAEGSKQLPEVRVIGDAVFARMLSALSTDEIGNLQDYLRRCIDALEGEGEGQGEGGSGAKPRAAAG